MIRLPSQLTPSELLYWERLPSFINTLLQSAYSLRKANRLPEAEQCAQDAFRASQELIAYVSQALALIHLGDLHREMDQAETAMTHYEKAYRIFRRQPSQYQRHNEAVAAYALGFMHQLLDNRLDALKWYQTSGQLFEKERKRWGLVNAVDQAKTCTRVQSWIEALSGYLTDVQIHANVRYIWIPIIPWDVEDGDEDELATTGLGVKALNDESFHVHPLKREGKHITLKSDIVYYALNIPYEASRSLDAVTGDHALVEQQDTPEQEGPGVLQSTVGQQDFGHFGFDDKGNVHFVCTDTQIIGDKDISKSLRVGYITALLKPMSAPPGLFAPPPPSPLADSAELYTQLVNMVGGDEETANRLIEHEHERTPDASRSELIDRAMVRLTRDRR